MLQIADEVVFDIEVAFVDRRDEGEQIHILQDRALVVVDNDSGRIAIGQAGDAAPRPAIRDLFDGEIELVTGDEIDQWRCIEASGRIDGDFGADQSDL
jgi:hypothetical protein